MWKGGVGCSFQKRSRGCFVGGDIQGMRACACVVDLVDCFVCVAQLVGRPSGDRMTASFFISCSASLFLCAPEIFYCAVYGLFLRKPAKPDLGGRREC